MRTLVLLESVQTGNAEVIDAATVPTSASSPTPVRDAVLALIFGLVLGVGLAVLLNLLDRRVKTVAGFEQRYGLRALAAIPQRLFGEIQNDGSVAEPFLILRSAVDYRSSWDAITVILVTSAGSGEGKTTVAVNLARSLALGGQQVALVEADLRRPSLDRFIDMGPVGPGLSTALAMDTPVVSDLVTDPVAPTLRVLPCGPRPPNPAELVRRRRMGEIIDYLSSSNDVVIIDSPPLLPVADTQSLLNLVQIDTVLVVARAFRTTRQEVTQARAILKRHEVEPLGLVVCGVRERLDYYQGYQPPPTSVRARGRGVGKAAGLAPGISVGSGEESSANRGLADPNGTSGRRLQRHRLWSSSRSGGAEHGEGGLVRSIQALEPEPPLLVGALGVEIGCAIDEHSLHVARVFRTQQGEHLGEVGRLIPFRGAVAGVSRTGGPADLGEPERLVRGAMVDEGLADVGDPREPPTAAGAVRS